MPDRPFFSICIPCYNHGAYIGQTIESVLNQDFDDFEIVVADNASPDNSREVVRSFGDPRIRLLENRYNIGFAPNLQQVTRHARGRFFNLLSSDDLMNPGTLSTYAEVIAHHPESQDRLVLMSQAWDIDEEGTAFRYITRNAHLGPLRTRMPRPEQIEAQERYEVYAGFDLFTAAMKHLSTVGQFCTVTYSRALWEQVEGYNSTQLINPDMHFIVKLLRLNPEVLFVNRPLYSYRSHRMGQNAQQARARVLKYQVDRYNVLMQYDEAWLQGTGVTPDDQRALFIQRDCLRQSVIALSRGQWLYATRLWAFAWATYPGVTARQGRSWALAALLATGPLGIGIAYGLRHLFSKGLPAFEDALRALQEQ